MQVLGLGAVTSLRGAAVPRAASNGTKVVAASERPSWAPGAKIPEYLDGSLPGDYGCDPFGLASEPKNLERFSEAELLHARWAMLGFAGIIGVELEPNAPGGWLDAALWFKNGQTYGTYVGQTVTFPLASVVGIQLLTMSISELKRAGEEDVELRKYPGGKFDPLGLADKLDMKEMKAKEIANGRLAMVACAGCFTQGLSVGGTPITNWLDHLADPGHNNLVGNGGLPFLLYGIKY